MKVVALVSYFLILPEQQTQTILRKDRSFRSKVDNIKSIELMSPNKR